MDPLILAIDQGTTSSRAIVFDKSGAAVAMAQQPFEQIYPAPGRVEHDPEAIWATTLATARAALAEAEARGGKVVSIGITNQRETLVLWDRDSLAPIGNAIVWQDRRTSAYCDDLRAQGLEPTITEKTGLLLDPYFSGSKLSHLLASDEALMARARRGDLAFGTIDAFLLVRLTGGLHKTDATNASRTSLFNIVTQEWDDDLLEIFSVPRECLPSVEDSNADFGATLPEYFGRAIPVCSMIGDQQAAAVGQLCLSPGDIKSTYGTGCFVIAHTGETLVRSKNRLLGTIAARLDGKTTYALEGSIFVAGAGVQWLRDELQIIDDAAQSQALAASIDDTGGVYLVPAFVGLGAPHWDADARAAIFGMTRGTGRAQIARATLEAVAYQTADLLDAIRDDGGACSVLKVDGGMVANDWLMQFMADILDCAVERPAFLESTALGAAMLAGQKAGVYGSLREAGQMRKVERTFKPAMAETKRAALREGWHEAVARLTR